MSFSVKIVLETRINMSTNSINRKKHDVLKVTVDSNSDFGVRIEEIAKKILPALNFNQANTSSKRDKLSVEADNLMGIAAEEATKYVLSRRYGPDSIKDIEFTSKYEQIDVSLSNNKTIEVRSSCIANGIDFALFCSKRPNTYNQYVDILGPYITGYKPREIPKDYYIRVLCHYNSPRDFLIRWYWGLPVTMYITGGANLAMMNDPDIYQIKNMVADSTNIATKSKYRVIPIGKSKDINEFFQMLEMENPEYTIIGNKTG